MGLFNELQRKYSYGPNYAYEIAVVCPAISPQFWLEMCTTFSTLNKSEFILIFVGHVRPDFPLPDGAIYIYSEMGCVPCIDIGYQYIFDNNLAPFITFVGDDLLFDTKPFLDNILDSYKKNKLDYPDRPMAVSNLSQAPVVGMT